jgi:regulator of replication initiation timing
MIKQTKIELVQINAALGAENEALRKQVADLTLIAAMHTQPTQRVARHMPQWQQDRAAAMAAARNMAMQARIVVKV